MECPNEDEKIEMKDEQGVCPNCEELKRKCENQEKDLDQMRKKIQDLEKTVAEKDRKVKETEDTLTVMQAESEVFKKDFEEERKDRVRVHQQLEALKSQPSSISETVAQSLQAEVLRTTQERDLLRIKLEDSKAQYRKLWDENERLNYDYECVCGDMRNLRAAYDKCQQGVGYYRDQLDLLQQKVSRRNTDPTLNYTVQDKLDITTSVNNHLLREKKDLEAQIEQLIKENKHLHQQLSIAERERGSAFSPDEGNLQHQGSRYEYNPAHEHSELRRPPSQRHFPRDPIDLSPRRFETSSRVHTSPQIRNRDSADQRYDVSPEAECRTLRTSSDGDMQSYRQEHWDRNGLEGSETQRPFRAGPKHTYANVPDPGPAGHRSDRTSYSRAIPHRRSRDEDLCSRRYAQDEDTRYTQTLQLISLQVGELSEAERTSVKEYVEDSMDSLEEEVTKDINLMCEMMKELRYDRQERIRTDYQRGPDPNLICPTCQRQFRLGEIQKYRKHTQHCGP